MDHYALRVSDLGKQYRIGARQKKRAGRLSDALIGSVTSALQRLRYPNRSTPIRETIWALRNVSFDVSEGEVIGVIGRNGAGKSTLLKILSRITTPTEGRVELWGRVGALLEVGTGFHPELTGRQNVYLNGAILGMRQSEIQRKFDEIVSFAEVEQFIDTPVKHYSSGMYMRLAFSVAAHLEPEILIVDEVLAVGDAAFQEKCLGQMSNVARQGRTVIFVSHNMAAIARLCSRCLLLDNGQLIGSGDTNTIIDQYLSHGGEHQPFLQFEAKPSRAYFTELMLSDSNGTPANQFDVRKPIRLYMKFVVEQPMKGLEASLVLFNHRMDRVFYHSHIQSKQPIRIDRSGECVLSVEIPGMLLPPGKYSWEVALHIPQIELLDKKDHVLNFEVIETGSGGEKFPAGALGYVLVDLSWNREKAMPKW